MEQHLPILFVLALGALGFQPYASSVGVDVGPHVSHQGSEAHVRLITGVSAMTPKDLEGIVG